MSTVGPGLYADRIDVLDSTNEDGRATHLRAPATMLSPAFQQRLDEASRAQEDLSQSRHKLLVQRERLRSSGNQVRAKRVETGDLEIAYMESLRQFVHEHASIIPASLFADFDKVQDAHVQLRTLEEDYLQAERSLGGVEVTFTEQEMDFYQGHVLDLLSEEGNDISYQPSLEDRPHFPLRQEQQSPEPSVATITQEYHNAVAQLDMFRNQFDALRPQQANHLEAEQSHNHRLPSEPHNEPVNAEFVSKYLNLLEKMTDCEVRVQRMKQDMMHRENLATVIDRRNSDPAHLGEQPPLPFDTITRAQTDSAIPTLLNDPTTKQRIRDWLLDFLQNSSLQRTLYLNVLGEFGCVPPDTESLRDYAAQVWNLDSSEQSHQAAEDPLSIPDNCSQSNDCGPSTSILLQASSNKSHLKCPPLNSERSSGSENFSSPVSDLVFATCSPKNNQDDGEWPLCQSKDDTKAICGGTNIPPISAASHVSQMNLAVDEVSSNLPTQTLVMTSGTEAQQTRSYESKRTKIPGTTETHCSSLQCSLRVNSSSHDLKESTSRLMPLEPTIGTVTLEQKGLSGVSESQREQKMSSGNQYEGHINNLADSEADEWTLILEEPKDIITSRTEAMKIAHLLTYPIARQEDPDSTIDRAAPTPLIRLRPSIALPVSSAGPTSEHKEKSGDKFSEWLRSKLKPSKSKSPPDIARVDSVKDRTSERTSKRDRPRSPGLEKLQRILRNI